MNTTFTLKENDWHVKIAKQHIEYNIPFISKRTLFSQTEISCEMTTDFCGYFRGIVAYCSKIVLMILLLAGIIAGHVGIVYYLLGTGPVPVILELSALFVSGAYFAVVFLCAMHFITSFIFSLQTFAFKKANKQKSLIAMKYSSIKNRFCPSLQFEKDNNFLVVSDDD